MQNKITICKIPGPRRNRYFPGKLLNADDLRAEQEYFLSRLRQLNRALFAPGILQGFEVSASGNRVSIEPGMAVDAAGRLLELTQTCVFELPRAEGTWDLVLDLAEEPVEPVPALAQGSAEADTTEFGYLQDIVKILLEEVVEAKDYGVLSSGVCLARIRLRHGTSEIEPGDGSPRGDQASTR